MKKIFIITSILCGLFLFIYHFMLDDTSEIDLLSHFFGGISVTIAITYIAINFTQYNINRPETILLILFFVILTFELLEYIFFTSVLSGVYEYYTLEFVMGIVNIIDTISDIIVGMAGGTLFLIFKRKAEERT